MRPLALGVGGALLGAVLLFAAPESARKRFAQPPPPHVVMGPPPEAWRFRPIDLTPHYNYDLTNSLLARGPLNGQNNLGSFPRGVHSFNGILFNVNGIVQLAGRQSMMARKDFPKHVEAIRVDRSLKTIHLLHGAGWEDEDGKMVAKMVIRYTDGRWRDVPIVYGKHVRDWWDNEDAPPSDPNTKPAWIGHNPVARQASTWLTVYCTSVPNPRPEARVESLDFISAWNEPALFVLGITGE
jgi:hypothetical protein